MSRDYKLKFDEYKDNDPTDKMAEVNEDHYPSPGSARNIAFVWPDGRMQFFNYSYLVTCSLDPDGGSISMEFSNHYVELKGQRLSTLFEELMMQTVRIIRCSDKRYFELLEKNKSIIEEIIISVK